MAIKYGMMKQGKKMASGGMCEHGRHDCEMCHGGKMMADGGEVHEEERSGYQRMPKEHMGEDEDMISRIMKKRSGHYSEGGRVANEDHELADFEPNEFDELAKDDHLEEHETGANSGDELGDMQEDEDRKDIVSRIMKSRRLKDRMPHPM